MEVMSVYEYDVLEFKSETTAKSMAKIFKSEYGYAPNIFRIVGMNGKTRYSIIKPESLINLRRVR